MGYFCVLAKSDNDYRGLDRKVICPENNDAVSELWEKYIADYDTDKFLCASSKMTLDELKKLTADANDHGKSYELIYFSEEEYCPFPAKYLGADIVTAGLRSNIKEGLIYAGNKIESEHYREYCEVNSSFKKELNSHGLFTNRAIAEKYYDILNEYNERLQTGDEPWHLACVYLMSV